MTIPRKPAAAAAIVLVVGVIGAWFFHRSGSDADSSAPVAADQLVIKPQSPNAWSQPAPAATPPWQGDKAPGEKSEPLAHLEPPQPVPGQSMAGDSKFPVDLSTAAAPPAMPAPAFGAPPAQSKSFGEDRGRFNADSAPYVAAVPSVGASTTPTTGPRTHRVVDGDTLGRLAEKYLGNPQRQTEIFEANRDRLKDPDLLPIGAELRIPDDAPNPPLKPVPPGALRPTY